MKVEPPKDSVICSKKDCGNFCYWTTTDPQELRCVKCGHVMAKREDIGEPLIVIKKPTRAVVQENING